MLIAQEDQKIKLHKWERDRERGRGEQNTIAVSLPNERHHQQYQLMTANVAIKCPLFDLGIMMIFHL